MKKRVGLYAKATWTTNTGTYHQNGNKKIKKADFLSPLF